MLFLKTNTTSITANLFRTVTIIDFDYDVILEEIFQVIFARNERHSSFSFNLEF